MLLVDLSALRRVPSQTRPTVFGDALHISPGIAKRFLTPS